jgi:hypothetical protein
MYQSREQEDKMKQTLENKPKKPKKKSEKEIFFVKKDKKKSK